MRISSYRDLTVWQKSLTLVVEIYKLTDKFPKSEIYGLVSQIRRSVISIPSNIAEGWQRGTKKDYRHFLFIAFGSGAELETQIEISKRLTFAGIEQCQTIDALLLEVMKMLNSMIAKLE